ncbi:MAG: hypothetical protein ACTSXG_01365 [Alphaproteobacteria bacterium]
MNKKQHNNYKSSIYLGLSFAIFSLFGLVVCIRILSTPSAQENAIIFSLSKMRLLLILINFVAISLLSFLSTLFLQGRVSIKSPQFQQPTFWAITFLFSFWGTILLLVGVTASLKSLNLLRYGTIRERLLPNLLWFLFICIWMLITSIIGYLKTCTFKSKKATISKNTYHEPRYIRYLYIFFILLFIFAEICSFSSHPHPRWGGDTDDYLYLAGKSVFSLEFFAGPRPWTTSLLYKVLGADLEIANYVEDDKVIKNNHNADFILIAQMTIHAISWIALAYSATSKINIYKLRPLLLMIVLAIGLSPAVTWWNHLLLSESISISLMIFLLSIWLSTTKGWQWHKAFLLLGATLLFIFTRETNALLIIILATLLILFGFGKTKRQIYLSISIIFILFYFASSSLSSIPNRWAVPLGNVIFHRILPDKNALDFFVKQGMPINSTVLDMEGKWVCDNGCAFLKEEKYTFFRDWLYKNGRTVYIHYLIDDFDKSLLAPLVHLDKATKAFLFPNFSEDKYLIPIWLNKLLFFNGAITFLFTFVLALISIVFKIWKTKPETIVVGLFFLLSYPHAFISYHGDAMEVGRHAIQFSIQLRLSFWLLLLMVLDWYLLFRRQSDNKKSSRIFA